MKVELLGTTKLKFCYHGNQTHEVSFVNIIPESSNQINVNHHILLADVSGSMSAQLKTLKDRIKITLDALKDIPNSYVSIISYSGHNQSQRIITSVKCDEISYKMSNVYNMVDSLSIKGLTVISEPLQMAINICKSLSNICNKHHIVLFTDGCLVPTKWDVSKEENQCFIAASDCKDKGYFLNAIGFGQYYDREFLKSLTKSTGGVVHIDSIKDYSDVILKLVQKVNDQTKAAMVLTSCQLFDISNSSFQNNTYFKNNVSDNNIICIIDKNELYGNDLFVNSQRYVVTKNQEPNSKYIDDFYYSLAKYYLTNDDIDNYEDTIKLLGDTRLYKETNNCYSFIEKGNSLKKVTEALEDESKRFINGRTPIIENLDDEKLCLLEILDLIMNDKHSQIYWDLETPYHRITQASNSIEDDIIFEPVKRGLIPISSLSIGSEKLNIGVKVKIDGHVIDKVSGFSKPAFIYRDYNLVNGGNINIPYINVALSDEPFKKLNNEGLIELNLFPIISPPIWRIDLSKIKTANKRILKSMTFAEIMDSLYDNAELKCEQWAVNQLIAECLCGKDKIELSNLSVDELEMRKTLRINELGIYQPLSVEKDCDKAFEVYPAIHMTWHVKIPEKITKQHYLDQIKFDLNVFHYTISDKFENNIEAYEYLQSMLKDIKSEIKELEFKVNCVRIASAIMNKSPIIWDEEIEKSKVSTDKVLNRNMVVGGKINVRKKVLNNNVLEEKRWIQLIKCN